MNLVLHQPEIPHNTGAIGRTALVTGSRLHLIHPLGFFIDEKSLKRCGLDYWPQLDVAEYDCFDEFLDKNRTERMHFVETGCEQRYTDVRFDKGDYIVFGGETAGLPKRVIEKYRSQTISIPMARCHRSLNLSVAVGIVLYEALRQTDFCI